MHHWHFDWRGQFSWSLLKWSFWTRISDKLPPFLLSGCRHLVLTYLDKMLTHSQRNWTRWTNTRDIEFNMCFKWGILCIAGPMRSEESNPSLSQTPVFILPLCRIYSCAFDNTYPRGRAYAIRWLSTTSKQCHTGRAGSHCSDDRCSTFVLPWFYRRRMGALHVSYALPQLQHKRAEPAKIPAA